MKPLSYFSRSSGTETWKPNLAILCVTQFLAMIGLMAFIPFLPLFVVELGVKDPAMAKIWSGLLFSGPLMTAIIMVPVWGRIGDRYGRKIMVIRAIFGLGVVVSLMTYSQDVWQLFILRLVQGALSGFIASAIAFVSVDAPSDKTGYAIGMLQSALAAGNILGPLFGGMLADISGIRPVFMIVGILCLAGGLLVVFFLRETTKPGKAEEKPSVTGNIRMIWADRSMRYLIGLIMICQAGIQFTVPIMAFFVARLGAPRNYVSTITGVMFGIIAFFSFILAPVWGRRNDKKDWHKTLAVAAAICGAAILLHLPMPHWTLLLPLRAVIGIFFAAILPTLYSALAKLSPESRKSGIMGLATSASMAGALAGFLLTGFVSSAFGLGTAFVCSGLLLLTASYMAWRHGKLSLRVA